MPDCRMSKPPFCAQGQSLESEERSDYSPERAYRTDSESQMAQGRESMEASTILSDEFTYDYQGHGKCKCKATEARRRSMLTQT